MPQAANGFTRFGDDAAEGAERMRREDTTLTGQVKSGLKQGVKQLSKLRIPFKAPSLLDKHRPQFSGIKRFGLAKLSSYWQDPYHSLLNLQWSKFLGVFFSIYFTEYILFAFLYWWSGNKCVEGLEGHFSYALWLSSRTASTLGFTTIYPKPECTFTNLIVIVQVIVANLVSFMLFGIVLARFSAPFKRASTIRFSTVAVVNRHASGCWCLSLRVANIRKHQILKPQIRMIMTAVDSITPSNYLFEHLQVEALEKQNTNLELGFPANVSHVITPTSPLWHLSLLEMDTRMMEVLVFVDGIDAMTSKNLSARSAYNTSEIQLNMEFAPLHLEMRGKSLGLDFSIFDTTVPCPADVMAEYLSDPSLMHKPVSEVQSHLWQLRHQTFKRLTERANGQASAARTPPGTSAQQSPYLAGRGAADSGSNGLPPPPSYHEAEGHPSLRGPLSFERLKGEIGVDDQASVNPFLAPPLGGHSSQLPVSTSPHSAGGALSALPPNSVGVRLPLPYSQTEMAGHSHVLLAGSHEAQADAGSPYFGSSNGVAHHEPSDVELAPLQPSANNPFVPAPYMLARQQLARVGSGGGVTAGGGGSGGGSNPVTQPALLSSGGPGIVSAGGAGHVGYHGSIVQRTGGPHTAAPISNAMYSLGDDDSDQQLLEVERVSAPGQRHGIVGGEIGQGGLIDEPLLLPTSVGPVEPRTAAFNSRGGFGSSGGHPL